MIRLIRYAYYREAASYPCADAISLSGVSKQKIVAVMPVLKETSDMRRRLAFSRRLVAMNGQLADEVHEFAATRLGANQLKGIWLREGRVIELRFGFPGIR